RKRRLAARRDAGKQFGAIKADTAESQHRLAVVMHATVLQTKVPTRMLRRVVHQYQMTQIVAEFQATQAAEIKFAMDVAIDGDEGRFAQILQGLRDTARRFQRFGDRK